MRTLLLGICIAIASLLHAQRPCASTEYHDQDRSLDPSLLIKEQQIEDFIQERLSLESKTEEENMKLIRIPVVVHVIYNNSLQNISDAQIASQIEVLNRDFRRLNGDTVNTPERFKSLAADMHIEFALATADPEGRPTNGIIRRKTEVAYWDMDDRIKQSAHGGDDAWDSHSYLNIWVVNLRGLLGYSSYLGCSSDKDGVVINYTAFGTINTTAPYHLGRTAVHEIGHWLGLKHIWGDTYCGDDAVYDTPRQGNFTAGCPSGFRSSCSNSAIGDMYMNYMDYTNDACVNLFTVGQKERMHALFAEDGPRYGLLSSKGLLAPWNEPLVVEPAPPSEAPLLTVFPNPASSEINLNFGGSADSWMGRSVRIVNLNGVEVARFTVTSKNSKFGISHLPRGVYFLRADNGTERINQKLVRL